LYASHFLSLSKNASPFSVLILCAISFLVSSVSGLLSIDLSKSIHQLFVDSVEIDQICSLLILVAIDEALVPNPFLSHLLLTDSVYFSQLIFFSTKQ
jgi:hypothetical protein